MSKIKLTELPLITIEWFAIDRQGNIAVFIDGGTAFVPKYVFENKERNEQLLTLFDSLPKINDEPDYKDYIRDWLEKGLYVYDADYEPRILSETYDLQAKPHKPLNYRLLPKEIRELLGEIDIDGFICRTRDRSWFGDIESFEYTPQITVHNEYKPDASELSHVPEYIRAYVGDITKYKLRTDVYLRCKCRCERFDVYKNALDPEEQKIKNEYDIACKRELPQWGSIYSDTDSSGAIHWYKRRFLFFKTEVFPPETPYFLRLYLFKARCVECGNWILLYDSRIIGQNAIEDTEDAELSNYKPKLEMLAQDKRVVLDYEISDDSSPDDFSEITIAVVSDEGYKKIFEYEM